MRSILHVGLMNKDDNLRIQPGSYSWIQSSFINLTIYVSSFLHSPVTQYQQVIGLFRYATFLYPGIISPFIFPHNLRGLVPVIILRDKTSALLPELPTYLVAFEIFITAGYTIISLIHISTLGRAAAWHNACVCRTRRS